MYDTAIYIGRFQPVHAGHLALLRRALECAPQVIVVLGSAWQARSPRNPFTVPEREGLLRAALPEADQARVQMLPVRDHYDEARWAQAVRSVHSPIGPIKPVSSATGMNLTGGIKPRSGCCQRIRTSTPINRPVARSICG